MNKINRLPDQIELSQILNHFPQMLYWRDIIKDCFILGNDKFASFIGVKDPAQLKGKTGYDFVSEELVGLFRHHEKLAIELKQVVRFYEKINHPETGETIIDVTIAPIVNENNEVTTIMCYGDSQMVLASKPLAQALKLISKEHMPNIIRASKYFININGEEVSLTKRETECCLYVLKGLTSKEIAKEMDLAPKTVDNYLETVKTKLGCFSRSDINKVLLESGFISHF